MKPPVETVRVSQRAKEILIRLKVKTGIDQWNVLCRWALCVSLQSPTPPSVDDFGEDSSVEMAWKVFAGSHADSLTAALALKSAQDGDDVADRAAFARSFRAHLETGIRKLQAIKTLDDLLIWHVSES
jgi:DNA sulfur modification protein DndE